MHSTLQPTRVYVEYPLNTLPQVWLTCALERSEPQGLMQVFPSQRYHERRAQL